MKHLRSISIVLFLVVFALLLNNCEQKSSTGPSSGQQIWQIGNISLTAEELQLYSLPGVPATTEITATVTDTAGTAIEGVVVKFSTPDFGSISSTQDTTDAEGEVTVTFNSQGQTGAATITASVTSGGTTTSRSITIYVTNLSGYPSEMSLSLFPDLLYWTETGVEDSIKVTVTITDSSNIGIPGLRINLASTLGVLSIPDTTNNIGKTTTYLYPGDEVGVGVVTASITISGPDPGSTPPDTTDGLSPGFPGGSDGKIGKVQSPWLTLNSGKGGSSGDAGRTVADSYTLTVSDTFYIVPLDQTVAGLSLEVSPTTVYSAPGQIDYIDVNVWVKDSLNVGISGVNVNLQTTLGVISSTGVTGNYGNFQTEIQIGQDEEGMGIVTAWVGDSPNSIGGQGDGLLQQAVVSKASGWPGLEPGLSLDSKMGRSADGGGNSIPPGLDDFYISDSDTFWILPISEQISDIALSAADYDLFTTPGVPATTTITATVSDSLGTAKEGILVHFTTPAIGSISLTQGYTNSSGQVNVTFSSDNEFGETDITAYVNVGTEIISETITIGVYQLANPPASIDAVAPAQVYIDLEQSMSFEVGAWVRDSLNVGLPNIQVTFSTTLGAIEIADPTNSNGYASTNVHNIDGYGTGYITATVSTPGGTLSDTAPFEVLPTSQQISGISVSAAPSEIYVAPDASGNSVITAIVVDENNNGVAGIPVSFGTDLGWLTTSGGTTDSSGAKTVTFNSTPNVTGTAHVWAYAGTLSDTCNVKVTPTAAASGKIELFTDTNLIYADNGITKAYLTAQLKDADNQVIKDALIIFTADHGTINSPVMTDTTGRAYAVFEDNGDPTTPDSARVIAKYNALNVADTVFITIAPPLGVDHINLSSGTNTMKANGLDSTRVDAVVYLENYMLAPAGTQVNFSVGGDNIGDFAPPVAIVSEAGTATTYYKTGVSTGIDSLVAEVEGVNSNILPMNLIPGPPTQIDVTLDPTTLPVNSSESITVEATVKDTTGNLVEDGVGVSFSTSLGSIWPPGATTVDGIATSYLSPSTIAGSAWIKASVGLVVDSALAIFEPSGPAYISLSAQFSSITVSGIGDTNQTAIYAHVKDAANNYVGNDVMVHFEIANNGSPFGGVNINNAGIEDSTLTSGGIATVVLNAGTNSGPVQIRAWAMVNDTTEIAAQQSLVTIVAGPPNTIEVAPMSDPVDAGGSVWKVEVAATCRDLLGNEVPDGYSVMFFLDPDTTGQIQGAAVTGNENWAGDTQDGVAFTTLTYQSQETFDVVNIYAFCMVGTDSVSGACEYKFPIADGTLTMSIVPIAWNFDNPPPGYPGEPAIMKCTATLKDGHNNYIDNGVLSFISPKGDFWFYENGQYPSNYKITGPAGFANEPPDSTGMAVIWLRTTFAQAFPNPDAIESTAQVVCQLQEYEDEVSSTPITVTFIHNIGDAIPPESQSAVKEE